MKWTKYIVTDGILDKHPYRDSGDDFGVIENPRNGWGWAIDLPDLRVAVKGSYILIYVQQPPNLTLKKRP